MSAQLPALKREKLLVGLKIDSISMADVQSLLHWANNRWVVIPIWGPGELPLFLFTCAHQPWTSNFGEPIFVISNCCQIAFTGEKLMSAVKAVIA